MLTLIGKIWKILPRGLRARLSRTLHATFTVSAAGVITNESGEVLLLNHLLRPNSGWGVPGGFIETAEQPEAAFRREIREEAGLELRNVCLHSVRTIGRHMEIIFTATGVGVAAVNSREIIELDWFSVDAMPPEMSLDQQFMVRKALGSDS